MGLVFSSVSVKSYAEPRQAPSLRSHAVYESNSWQLSIPHPQVQALRSDEFSD